ncbi:NADH dehydrogenase subunit 6 [Basidiobolus ranarum]|uniref:NADH dehydrogenase subunit 6 n=1 Tax=Basidiobolus ranarum TaxID=34480 RepID=A0ABR2WCD1_9FUNG
MKTLVLNMLTIGGIVSGIITISSVNPVYSVIGLISVFVISAIYLIILGVTFIGISYLIIYVGAIAILFIFVVMMMNTHRYIELTEVGKEYTRNIPLAGIIGMVFLLVLYPVVDGGTASRPSLLGGGYSSFDSINFGGANALPPLSRSSIGLAEAASPTGAAEEGVSLVAGPLANWAPSFEAPLSWAPAAPAALANQSHMHPGLTGSTVEVWEKVLGATWGDLNQLESIGLTLYTNFFIWFLIGSCILLLAMVGPIVLTYRARSPEEETAESVA